MLNSKVFTVLSIVVLSFIIYGILKDRPKVLNVKNDVREIRSQIAQLKENNQKLGGLAEYFKSQAYKEKEAKLKLNLKKPDEEVVIIKKENPNDKAQISNQIQNSKSQSILNKIGEWFEKLLSKEI